VTPPDGLANLKLAMPSAIVAVLIAGVPGRFVAIDTPGSCVKVALSAPSALSATEHVPVPLQIPPQPENLHPDAGIAVNVVPV
jgi:hypothetical protein